MSQSREMEQLKWMAKHKGVITVGHLMKTRRGGTDPENLVLVWMVEWEASNGDLIQQTPDHGYQSIHNAIEAAMDAEQMRSSCR